MSATLKLDLAKVASEIAELPRRLQEGMQRLDALEHSHVSIAESPCEVVYSDGKLRLLHYKGSDSQVQRTPTLLVYALVGRYSVADLQPGALVRREPAARRHRPLCHRLGSSDAGRSLDDARRLRERVHR